MATITARGMTIRPVVYGAGEKTVTVTGDGMVAEVKSDDERLRLIVKRMIRCGDGLIANGYHPIAGSMLQAYATLLTVFERYNDVTVEGDIGTIPMPGDHDAIY